TDENGRALYFSRAPIPFAREAGSAASPGLYWQHLGVYACRRPALERWVRLKPPPAELAERLEQLRALHYGMVIGGARLERPAHPGVDTPDDLRRAEAHWVAQQRGTKDERHQHHEVHLRYRGRGLLAGEGNCGSVARPIAG